MSTIKRPKEPLSVTHPILAKEWDYEKNGDILPSSFSAGSGRKVWWKDALGHEWLAAICNRVQGKNCPYCSNPPKQVLAGFNDLETWCKENNLDNILDEWDYQKNTFAPNSVLRCSGEKVWWKCKKFHSWNASIANRVKGRNCPYCSGKKVCNGENDLQTNYPGIALEWDYEKNGNQSPGDYTSHSNKKVWWKCRNCKNSWRTSINHRVDLGTGCPYCSGHKVAENYNDLKSTHPDLLNEWDFSKNTISPSNVSFGSNKKVWWKCSKGHEWKVAICERAAGKGCPYCAGRKVLIGFNDLATLKPDIAKEWDYDKNGDLKPANYTLFSHKYVWWKCSKGHVWEASISRRTAQGSGCPYCAITGTSFPEQAVAYYISKTFRVIQRYKIEKTEIDIFLQDFNIGIEYDGMFYHTGAESDKKEKRKDLFCENRNIILIRVKEDTKFFIEGNIIHYVLNQNYLNENFNEMIRTLLTLLERKTGNKTVSDIDVVRDELAIKKQYDTVLKNNSVAISFPDLIQEWNYEKNENLAPESFAAFSNTKVWWKCKDGHEWQAKISDRAKGKNCPYCSGRFAIPGKTDLATTSPELLSEWDYVKNAIQPTEVSSGSEKKVWWNCSQGHQWQAVIASRTGINGTSCPYCSGRFAIPGKTDLATTNPELLKEWDYSKNVIKPTEISAGSGVKVWWKCSTCGYEWQNAVASRVKQKFGCSMCSRKYVARCISKKVINIDTGEIYASQSEAFRRTGINNITACCKGKQKTAGGYHWRYVE